MFSKRPELLPPNCQSVSTSEAGDEIFQVLFEAEFNQEDGSYLLLQRAFLEEDDGDNVSCYVETRRKFDRTLPDFSRRSLEEPTDSRPAITNE